MGIDFIRKAAPSFRKGLDRRRIELGTPNLFTQGPTSAPRAYAAQLRSDKTLAVGEKLGVRLEGQNAQPKKSAAPIFRRMLASHERSLAGGKLSGEPEGQLAARELEVTRIRGVLQRAEELPADVAAAIESASDLISITLASRSARTS